MVNSGLGASPGLKILHVIAKSYPSLNGYTVRSHEMFKAQKKTGVVLPFAITSPYYPKIKEMNEFVEIDNISYYRTLPSRRVTIMENWKNYSMIQKLILYPFRLFRELLYERSLIIDFQRNIESLTEEENPDILHAHTPFKVGLPTMRVARKLRKPFIYEVRGLWEESAISRGRFTKWNLRYWRFRFMENRVMRSADRVFCLSNTMKEQLIRRGLDRRKISIIRNGAPEEYLEEKRQKELNLDLGQDSSLLRIKEIANSKSIIGYVGSVQKYEGLEDLVDAVGKMISNKRKVHLLIISNGDNKKYLEEICGKEQICRDVTIVGPIPRNKIREYYREIDIIAIPRLGGSTMARVVTPLKPMEALALGIPLVISDTPAIRELVGEGNATLFESGNIPELYQKLCITIDDKEATKEMVERGIRWIRNRGTWEISAKETLREYNKLIQSWN